MRRCRNQHCALHSEDSLNWKGTSKILHEPLTIKKAVTCLCRMAGLLFRLGGFEIQRGRIDAVTLPGGCRTVVEEMPKVGATMGAHDLGPHHEMTRVFNSADSPFIHRIPETGPTASCIKLRVRCEEFLATADAGVHPFAGNVPVFAGERPFCSFFTRYSILFGSELFLPFFVGLRHGLHLCLPLWGGLRLRLGGKREPRKHGQSSDRCYDEWFHLTNTNNVGLQPVPCGVEDHCSAAEMLSIPP